MAASSLETLHERIAQQNDLSLENIRIEKICDVFIAIDVSKEALKGTSGAVYPAFPIDCTGKVHKNIQLMAKIIEYQDIPSSIPQEKTFDNHGTWQHAKPQKTWVNIQIEARNNNALFSSTAAQTEDGAIILMSKVPGRPLLNLIDEYEFNRLKIITRIRLGIKAIIRFEKLHKKGIFPIDITAANTMISLPTLDVTPIDLGYSDETELTRAPENKVTAEFNIYSIGIDILIPILSGLRSEKNKAGEILNILKIEVGIMLYCNDSSVKGLAEDLISLIQKMCSSNPQDRGTLKDTRETLEYLASLIEKPILNDAAQSEYNKQLRVLENEVLNNPMFKVAADKKILEGSNATLEKSGFGSPSNFFPAFRQTISPATHSTTLTARH